MEGQIPRRCASSITEILHRRFRFDTSRRTGNAGIVCLRGSFTHPFAIRQYMADQLDCRPWPWDTPSSVSYSLKKNGKVSTTCKCNFTYTPLEVAAQTTVQLWFTILVCAIVKLSRLFVDPMVYCRYGFGFGSPVSRALGIGYVQELVARLTHTPIKTYNSSTNSTLDGNPITFPLDQSLYVDATHDGLVLSGNCCSSFSWYVIYLFKLVIAALNLNTFAESGPLSYTHIRHDRSFRVSELAPFATNIQFQRVYSFLPSTNFLISIISFGVYFVTGPPNPGHHQWWRCSTHWDSWLRQTQPRHVSGWQVCCRSKGNYTNHGLGIWLSWRLGSFPWTGVADCYRWSTETQVKLYMAHGACILWRWKWKWKWNECSMYQYYDLFKLFFYFFCDISVPHLRNLNWLVGGESGRRDSLPLW